MGPRLGPASATDQLVTSRPTLSALSIGCPITHVVMLLERSPPCRHEEGAAHMKACASMQAGAEHQD